MRGVCAHVTASGVRDGKIGVWLTDNGQEFDGDDIDDVADEVVRAHARSVSYVKNTNACAERDHGVVQRSIRCCAA